MSGPPVYIRTHFMLATGDGTPGLKWGSTNAYTEDASGRPVYDWTITDRIFDTYLQAGAKPFVEIGFMPQALSSQPDAVSVRSGFPAPSQPGLSSAGPILPRTTQVGRIGLPVGETQRREVREATRCESWYWEVWNEPDISYWHGTPEEYDKLYDYAAAAVKRALPSAKVGGPATTGPSSAKAAAFLRQFLEHCARQECRNRRRARRSTSSPITPKAGPRWWMAMFAWASPRMPKTSTRDTRSCATFPKFASLPIVLSESDPEGCAACSARVYPQNAYRNGTLCTRPIRQP